MSTPFPTDPLQAVTHADPYPYYAALARDRPLYRDARLGLWVASLQHGRGRPGDGITAQIDHEASLRENGIR